jgi:Ca-activated chloride channel family protein
MTFARPIWLVIALVAVALFAVGYRALERRRDARALAYSSLQFALDAMRPSRVPAALLFGAWIAGVGALTLALAGPRFTAKIPSKDGTVVLCIDTSGSMRAMDVEPTRSEAAKAAALAFVDAVPDGTRVGIVTFSSDASSIIAPNADKDAVRDAIAHIPPPDGGTAIGDAMALAAHQMPEKGRRAIVVLTDGINNRGVDPIDTSREIGIKGISIDTVGVGTSGSGQVIPGTTELAELDEDALREIARNGSGTYAAASDASTLQDTFRRLALETVWESKHVDGSLGFAIGGGLAMLAAFLVGLGTGRVP